MALPDFAQGQVGKALISIRKERRRADQGAPLPSYRADVLIIHDPAVRHVGTSFGRNPPISCKMLANSVLGTATSASWNLVHDLGADLDELLAQHRH